MNKEQKDFKKSRRNFFKKGVFGVAGISLLPSILHPHGQEHEGDELKKKVKESSKNKPKLIYRTLGRTGIKLPIIGFGCVGSDNPQLIRAALDLGITYFDTANVCLQGQSEIILGKVLKEQPRDSFVVSTKTLIETDARTGLFPEDTDIKKFKKKFADSLKRLQLDYVDILYLHMMNNDKALGFKPIMEAMLDLKKEGKTRFLGVSTHGNEPEVIYAAVEHKIYDVVLTAYNFRQPHREEIKKTIAYAAKAGLGVVVMKTRAGVYWDREQKHLINIKAALKWVLQDENVHASTSGITSFDQLESDISILEDLTLTPQEMADLKLGETTGMTGLFCPQCGKCRSQCRYNLEIPTLMRCYMYAYGYKNPAQSKWILQQEDPSAITCRNCRTCAVSCTMGFNVPKKIKDIIRVLEVPGEFLA